MLRRFLSFISAEVAAAAVFTRTVKRVVGGGGRRFMFIPAEVTRMSCTF